MFNLLNNPPVPSNDVSAFFALLELVSNPEQVKARLCELANAVMEANEAVGPMQAAQAQLKTDRAAHDEYLKTSRAEFDAEIKASRAKHDQDCKIAMDQIRRKTAETDRLHAQAAADATAAAKARADLEGRLDRIKQAAA